jgi:hypothetical protein
MSSRDHQGVFVAFCDGHSAHHSASTSSDQAGENHAALRIFRRPKTRSVVVPYTPISEEADMNLQRAVHNCVSPLYILACSEFRSRQHFRCS